MVSNTIYMNNNTYIYKLYSLMSIFLYIFNNIIKDSDDNITRDSGEYVVSELARKSVIEVYDYLDIPSLVSKRFFDKPL